MVRDFDRHSDNLFNINDFLRPDPILKPDAGQEYFFIKCQGVAISHASHKVCHSSVERISLRVVFHPIARVFEQILIKLFNDFSGFILNLL